MKHFIAVTFVLFTLVQIGQAQVTKRVLVEKFTSAGCGNCPDGTARLINLTAGNPNIIWVSHHSGFITDPMLFPEIDSIADLTDGAPKAAIDRIKYPNETTVAASRNNWQTYINNQLTQTASVDVSANGTFDANTRNVSLTVNAMFPTAMTATGEYRINVFVVEDSVIGTTSAYHQSNYFNNTAGHYYQGAGNPILNYPHRHVTRAVPSTAWGNSGIIPNSPTPGTTYSATYNFNIPTNYVKSRVHFVVFVTDYSANIQQRNVLNSFDLNANELTIITSTENLNTVFNKISVAPNPVQNQATITIESEESNELALTVFDALGRPVKTNIHWSIHTGTNQMTINVDDLDSGLYYIQLTDGKAINTQRIIVL
jgi:hypothetical protein